MSRKHESYADKLRRPEWQKKRLEILDRDGWKCVECGDKKSELHVHHAYYGKSVDPWAYPDESMKSLCKSCHEEHESARAAFLDVMGPLCLEHWKAFTAFAISMSSMGRADANKLCEMLRTIPGPLITRVIEDLWDAVEYGHKRERGEVL